MKKGRILLGDKGDTHGLSILHYAAYNGFIIEPALLGEVITSARLIQSALPQASLLVVADLPLPAPGTAHVSPGEVVDTYCKLKQQVDRAVFLDHHKPLPGVVQYLDKLRDCGWEVRVDTGLSMTKWLCQHTGREMPDIQCMLLVFGNIADMDKSVFDDPMFRDAKKQLLQGGLGLDYVYRMMRFTALTKDLEEMTYLALEVGEKLLSGELPYPPMRLAREIEQSAQRVGDVLLVDASKFSSPWFNKAVSLLLMDGQYNYVVSYRCGVDSRTGKHQCTVSVYAPWYRNEDLLTFLSENLEEVVSVYGHPTFATAVLPDNVDVAEVARRVAELLAKG